MPSAARGGARTAWAPTAASWAASPASTGRPWATASVSTACLALSPPCRDRGAVGHLCQGRGGEGGGGGSMWPVGRQIMPRVCFLGRAACLCLDFSLPGIWNRHCIVLLSAQGESWAGYSHPGLGAGPQLPVSCACWSDCLHQAPARQCWARGKLPLAGLGRPGFGAQASATGERRSARGALQFSWSLTPNACPNPQPLGSGQKGLGCVCVCGGTGLRGNCCNSCCCRHRRMCQRDAVREPRLL